MRVGEILNVLTQFFHRQGIENAHVDAELLIAHVLRCKRLDLFLNYDKPLTQQQADTLRTYAKLRTQKHPLQYILGSVDFYGQRIKVDARVLIPRPETEELIHQLSEYWGDTPPQRVIDLGTGSGAIAITLVTLFPHITMTASDAYADALCLAIENATVNRVAHKIQFLHSDWFEKIPQHFDCIISNPPYLTEQEWMSAQPEVQCFEPKHALVSKDNGLADIKKLLGQGIKHLNPHGCIVLETGMDQHSHLHSFAKKCGYRSSKTTLDLHKRGRFFWAWL
ncbi:MAG: peptide chain release factor N(5)-glutamine methyltransferase [Puniceicoccales bacterium]|jgi:release factor glutamine methyltransferase|nr:peptide chain release factor N(5)-glutamine methyltransferase [Puniceicoccales bacterium]